MSLYRRNNGVYCYQYNEGKRRVRKSLRTRNENEAKELHAKLETERFRVQRLGEQRIYLWEEAVLRYLQESKHKTRLACEKRHLAFIYPFLEGKPLNKITKQTVYEIIQKKREKGVVVKKKGKKNQVEQHRIREVSIATLNYLIRTIKVILNQAHKNWEWLDKVPYIPLLKGEKKHFDWLTFDQANKLLQELPDHLHDIFLFSLETGLRKSNVLNLKFFQIDFEKQCVYFQSNEIKNKESLLLPLSDDALAIIRRQPTVSEYVFTYKGQHINNCNTKAFRNALKRAGIKNFRWHDIRATWTTWHIMKGTPLPALTRLGGWKNEKMPMHYFKAIAPELREHLSKIGVTNLAQRHLKVVVNN